MHVTFWHAFTSLKSASIKLWVLYCFRKPSLARLGETHCSHCHPERETALSYGMPQNLHLNTGTDSWTWKLKCDRKNCENHNYISVTILAWTAIICICSFYVLFLFFFRIPTTADSSTNGYSC
jgi:hypothetical protein